MSQCSYVCVVCCQVISECCALLEKECVSLSAHVHSLRVLPLHVDVGTPAVQQVYEGEEECVRRRVVLTDVLGESSFSLNNIRYVIDTGLQLKTVSPSTSHKHLINISPFPLIQLRPPPQIYNPQIRADSQVQQPISKQQADARSRRVSSKLSGEETHPCECTYHVLML